MEAEKWPDGIFPIAKSEAAVLYELGWSSGFGWATEWDWWPNGEATEAGDSYDTRCRFAQTVLVIRRARDIADQRVVQAYR